MTASWRDRLLSQTWPLVVGVLVVWFGGLAVIASACSADATTRPAPTGPIVASPPPTWERENLRFQVFEVRVGERTITCIRGGSSTSSVLSCDWSAK